MTSTVPLSDVPCPMDSEPQTSVNKLSLANETTKPPPLQKLSTVSSLSKITINDVLQELKDSKPASLISIPSNATVEAAVDLLSTKKILSAPIQDPTTSQYLGIVDMADILHYIFFNYNTKQPEEPRDDHLKKDFWILLFSPEHNDRIEFTKQRFITDSILKVIELQSTHPLDKLFSSTTPFPEILKVLGEGGLKRIFIGESGKLTGILTQMDIIRYLHKHVTDTTTIKDLNLGQDPDLTFNKLNAIAFQAFYLMCSNEVSAVAIVDDNEKLKANLGISDLKGLKGENFNDITLKVMDFLEKYCPNTKIPPIVVNNDVTFTDLLNVILKNRIHRVWNVGANEKVVGVIALSDIISVLHLSLK